MLLWYALHVHSQCERIVADKLAGAGIEAFYPHLVKRSNDDKREIEHRRFMPGYVFAHFDLEHKTPVVAVAQVVSILGFGSHAVSIPPIEIEAVKLIVSFPELAMPCPFVNAGDRVRVVTGPLRGLEGYVSYSKSVTRVIVSVQMLARSIAAEVDIDSLEMMAHAPVS